MVSETIKIVKDITNYTTHDVQKKDNKTIPNEVIGQKTENKELEKKPIKTEVSTLSVLFEEEDNKDKKMSLDEQTIKKAVETANKKVVGPNIELSFSVHEKTNSICIKVVDQQTGEIIREIPSEKILDMIADICNISGKVMDIKK